MGVVILNPDSGAQPRQPAPSSGLQIISRRRIAFRCLTPSCRRAFYEDEERQYTQHVIACAKSNEGEIREHADLGSQMPGLFGPNAGDVERKTWLRERKGWRV